MKITIDGDRLAVSGDRWPALPNAVRLDDIVEVASEKMDKITYEELFLILRGHNGTALALGELDDGIDQAAAALRSRLPGFPADWRTEAESHDAGVRAILWRRP